MAQPHRSAIPEASLRRWHMPAWGVFANKVLKRLRSPVDLKLRFDHREDMVSMEQIGNFQLLLRELFESRVQGDLVELGSYVGSSTAVFSTFLASCAEQRTLHAFDRFDMELGSLQGIRARFDRVMRECGGVMPVVHQGDVLDTVPAQLPERIAFAHIDLGWGADFDRQKLLIDHVIRHVHTCMSPGGIMVFMDYHIPGVTVHGHDSNPAVREACDAFFARRPERIHLLYGGTCSHAYVRC